VGIDLARLADLERAIDETGWSDFSDKMETSVLVPSAYEPRSVQISVDSHGTRKEASRIPGARGAIPAPLLCDALRRIRIPDRRTDGTTLNRHPAP
jgi:hypothetical protein